MHRQHFGGAAPQIYVFRICAIIFSGMVAFDKLSIYVKSQTPNSLIRRCYAHLFDGEALFLDLILEFLKLYTPSDVYWHDVHLKLIV